MNERWAKDALTKEAGGVFSPSAPGKWAGKEGSHTPVISANADGSVTISTPHGMENDHWIEYVYAKDASSGAVIAIANFTGAGTAASLTFTPAAGTATEIQPFSFCNKHNTWQGVSLVLDRTRARRDRETTSQDTEYEQTSAAPGVINLKLGQPSPRLLPLEAFRRGAAHRLADGNAQILQYGNDVGYGSYRVALAAFLTRHLDWPIAVDPNALMATCGNSFALALVCDVVRQRRRAAAAQHSSTALRPTIAPLVAIVEQPTYYIAGAIFESAGWKCVGIQMDGGGLRPELLDAAARRAVALYGVAPSLVYTIPRFHNPLGVSLTRARGEELLMWAQRNDALVVADEPYSLLQYNNQNQNQNSTSSATHVSTSSSSRLPSSLMELDRNRALVVSMGSYSKILSPGMRCGWLHAAPPLVAALREHGVLLSGGGLNPVLCGVAHSLIELGILDTHLAMLRRTLAARRTALITALRELLPAATLPHADAPAGGYFLWLILPPCCPDAAELLAFCEESDAGVAFTPGLSCCAAPIEGGVEATCELRRSVRLSFAFYEKEELREGVLRLAHAVQRYEERSGSGAPRAAL